MGENNCSVSECERPARTKGMCSAHYCRFKRSGNPLGVKSFRGESISYLNKIVIKHDKDECLIWPYAKDGHGYGTVRKNEKVHRIVCFETHGEPPEGKNQAAHKCGNRACVAPKHIRWASQKENEADKLEYGMKRGRPFGSKDKNPRKIMGK